MMSEDDLPRNVYFGDGSVIDDSVMEYLGNLYGRLSVGFPLARARCPDAQQHAGGAFAQSVCG